MNLAPLVRLSWKEYRTVRAFWLSLVILAVLLQWFVSAVSSDRDWGLMMVYSFALAAPAFFALGCTGAAFAVEQEEGTFEFLRAAPVRSVDVLVSKLALAALATAAMFVVLWPLALLVNGGLLPTATQLNGMSGLWLLAALEAIAWGTLFSLLTARPLVAVCLGLIAVSTMMHLLAWSAVPPPIHAFELAPYLAAVPRRALVVIVVLAADVYLGLRWLKIGEARPFVRPRFMRRNSIANAHERAIERNECAALVTKPDRAAILGRLLWQHWRQSARLMCLMAGLYVFLSTLAMSDDILRKSGLAAVPIVFLAALMGCFVFLADQEKRRYRFFAEHSIPPRSVWLTRQLPWLLTVVLSTLLFMLMWCGPRNIFSLWLLAKSAMEGPPYFFPRTVQIDFLDVPNVWLALKFVAVSYAAGQWASMAVRSGIMAGFVGLVLAGVLCVWVMLLDAMQVNWLWSVAPIPLVLLWATWLRAPDWVGETTTWRARVRAAAAVLVPALTLLVAVPLYRVHSVPLDSFDLRDQVDMAPITPEARATADLYRRASELYVSREIGWFAFSAAKSDRAPTWAQREWLEENAASLNLVLEAARRADCVFDDPRTTTEWSSLPNGIPLVQLVIVSARHLEAEGKLDEALDRYFTALGVASQLVNNTWDSDSRNRVDRFNLVFRELAFWAAQKGQTVERIREAIEKLQALDSRILGLEQRFRLDYAASRRFALGDPFAYPLLFGRKQQEVKSQPPMLWPAWMPREKYRGLSQPPMLWPAWMP